MSEKIIRNLKDVAEVAKKLFPCGLKRLDETHAQGYMGVKLIVGIKPNPVYEANADPNKPGLTVEQRKIEEVKANPEAADIRIVWIRPWMTAQELQDEWLLPIKKSLEKVPPIVRKIKEIKSKDEKSDLELAQQVIKGEDPEIESNDFDDDTEEIGMDQEIGNNDEDAEPQLKFEPKKELSENKNEILEAIKILSQNIDTLSSDLGTINDTVINLDNRISTMEGKEPKAKVGRPKSK